MSDHPARRLGAPVARAIPAWPHSRGWGYGPSGVLGLVVLVVIVMLGHGRL
jgi:hypothetical protein